jgi:hypothetical protein
MTWAEAAPFVNTALIVVGWAVVHFTSRNRDRDKARRDLVVKAADALSDQVAKLVTVAVSYHSGKERESPREIEIKSTLQDLSLQTQLINQAVRPVRDGVQSSKLHNAFKQSVTARHFEDEWDKPLSASGVEVSEIAAAGIAIRAYFAEIKFEQFER